MEVRLLVLFLGLVYGEKSGCVFDTLPKDVTPRVICSNISSFNNIATVSQDMLNIVHILIVNGSNISTVPESAFVNLPDLKTLDLDRIHLKDISVGAFSNLSNLIELIATHNEIETLEVGIFEPVPNLEFLFLDGNQIKHINDSLLRPLRELKVLSLRKNNISTIAGGVFDSLVNMNFLDLSQNPLETFYPDSLPENLTELSLHTSLLKEIKGSYYLPKLQEIWLDYAEFTVLKDPFFNGTKGLRLFSLQGNNIATIFKFYFLEAKSLKDLYLSQNKIKVIHPVMFQDMINLRHLYLDDNWIEMILNSTFDDLISLEVLNLSQNKLTELAPQIFQSLGNLIQLDFSYNFVDSIDVPGIMKYMPNLEKVRLDHNRWMCRDIFNIYEAFVHRNVTVENVNIKLTDSTQTYGIACANEESGATFDEIIRYSPIKHLFSETFTISSFYRFFDEIFEI